MLKKKPLLLSVLILSMTLICGTESFAAAKRAAAGPKVSAKAVDLRLALRDLWGDHIFWVRSVVFATKFASDDAAKAAEGKVVENAHAIAGAIGSIYGKENGDKFFNLLAAHYGGIKDYMTAVNAKDETSKSAATEKLKANVDEIASFVSSANPNLPKDTLVNLLSAHIGHHMTQIDELATGDFEKEARTRDEMKANIFVIADALQSGIVKQFPGKF